MKKAEIRVGGLYTARVSGRFVTVRVDAIREVEGLKYPVGGAGSYGTKRVIKATTDYICTNLSTGRTVTFRSAAKFRSEAKPVNTVAREHYGVSDSDYHTQEPDPIRPTTPLPDEENAEDEDAKDEEGEQGSDPTQRAENDARGVGGSSTGTVQESCGAESVTAAALAVAPTMCSTSLSARLAAAMARPDVPTHTADGRKLTQQQYDILLMAKAVEAQQCNGLRVVRIKAGAGTGKTEELRQLERVLTGTGQYTAYNTSLVADSKPKFKKAACNTTHSLAFRAVGKLYAHRLNGPRVRSAEIARRLGIGDFEVPGKPYPQGSPEYIKMAQAAGYSADNPPPEDFAPRPIKQLKASFLAGQVLAAIDRFCQSDDRQITARTFRPIGGIDEPGERTNSDKVKAYLLPFAQKAWADLSDPNGTVMPFKHGVYVKVWALGDGPNRPVIASNYIMLDEAQDTAPVVVGILKQQTHALLVLVGDDNQEIYRWRGAENAMAHFDDAPTGLLSQSFRFGQAVADVANTVLATLDTPTNLVMSGLPATPTDELPGLPTRVCVVANPKCYLYRTNAGAIGRLMSAKAEGKRGHLIGKADEVVKFCRAAIDLQAGRSTDHPELGCFANWTEVKEYSKTDEGSDLKLMVKLVDDFGAEEIIAALEDMPSEQEADLILCTAHKSKGREWPTVKLGQDFPLPNRMGDEERRLVYVAVTRAQEELDISECPTFMGGWDRSGSGSVLENGFGSTDDQWIPGLEIAYTAPMPTAEALATYRATKANGKAASVPTTPATPAPQANGQAAPIPAPAATSAAPATNGNGEFSWANLGDAWGVRGRAGYSGKRVTVIKKNGQQSQVTLGEVARTVGEWTFYRVV